MVDSVKDGAGAIAIIPARGGSKGLPRKNILPLLGKPLIAYAIAAARSARHVERVVVSTDCAEIAQVARAHGAEVVMRPAELAGDLSGSELALLHVIDTLYPEGAPAPDILVFLQCTSPLTIGADIDGLVDAMLDDGADSAFTATRFWHFVWRSDEDENATGVNHDHRVRQMRQQRRPEYLETGAAYAMRVSGFRAHRHRFFGRIALFDTPAERVAEIDDQADFDVVTARLRAAKAAAVAADIPDRPSALIMDFDGVMTDDRVFVDQDGTESVVCSRRDGMGIEALRKAGLPMIVLSKETNPVVLARCAKLGLDVVAGLDSKRATLDRWAAENGVDLDRAIYVGNDINDLECFERVGCAVAPCDAHPAALDAAAVILDADGGRGAIRLLSDIILARNMASRLDSGAPAAG